MTIRAEEPKDHDAIRSLNLQAFGGPAEGALVDRLRNDGLVIASLVAVDEAQIVGHILFSRIAIHTATSIVSAVALAPMAVIPSRQRQGIGSALVEAGLRACRSSGERIVIVLGHLDYYPRFGFSTALASKLRSPYSGPDYMALELVPGALATLSGEARYPPAFGVVS